MTVNWLCDHGKDSDCPECDAGHIMYNIEAAIVESPERWGLSWIDGVGIELPKRGKE